METKNVQNTKKRPTGLINAAKIVGLVYFIVDIVAIVTFAALGIVYGVEMSKAVGQQMSQVIAVLVMCIVFVGIFIAATILAHKSWSNSKKDIVNSKGLSIANIIFNTACGILTIIIYNKKQAGEF